MENKTFLKRTSPKPYPIKGLYNQYKSPATRACILLNQEDFYEVNVWDLNKNGYPWSESSYSYLHKFIKLNTYEVAKQWLIENYGGKWCEDKLGGYL